MNEIKIIEVENEDVVITLDGSVACWSEIYGDPKKSKALMALLDELLKLKVDSNELIEGDTKCKITYDEKGLVISGEDLTIEDLPELLLIHIKDIIATAEEVNILHGIEITTEELNRLKGLLVTAEELNRLAGLNISIDDLNSVINKLDKNPPITAGTYAKVKVDEKGLVTQGQKLSESDVPSISLSKVYDVTVSNNVLNKLAGLEVGASELNQLKDIEGNVQTQLNKYFDIIPDEATLNNQLADKKFVRDWVYDHAGYYVTKMPNGKPFESKQELIDTVTFYHLGEVKRLSENDFAVVEKDETQGYQMAVYIYDRDEVYNEGHWILQYIIPRDAGYITNVIMNGVLQPVTDNVVNLGAVITEHQDISGKQDIIPDLDTIRKGAELGATAIQSIPSEYVTETELNNKGYLTSYTETDPIYIADKPNIALKSDIPSITNLATKTELQNGLNNKQDKGDYALKSEIPTNNNQLANGAGYITSEYHDNTKQDVINDLATIRSGASKGATALQTVPSEYVTETELNAKGYLTSYTETDPIYTADKPNLALKSEIPTKVSSLTNDANYQTATDVASMIASIPQFEIKIVDALPSQGQKMVLYLVPKTSASGDNIYDEYIWLESTSSFELVGSTTVDLSDYATKDELNLKVGNDEFVGMSDLTKTLTVKTRVSSFTTLGLNAIGSDSTYQDTPINSGTSHWSSNAKSGLKIYIAFDKPTNANAISLFLNDTATYGYPQINIYGGNSIADATTNLLLNEKGVADENYCNLGDVEYQYFLIDLTHNTWINCRYAYIMKKKDGIIRGEDYLQIKKDITQNSNAIARKEDKPTITKPNNKSGVIKHTDGRMEQWGLATSSTTGETEFTINANFIDTDFQVFIEPRQADDLVHYAIPSATNKFKARIKNTSGSDMACQFQWRAYGFWM